MTTVDQHQSKDILTSAQNRARHMAKSIEWFASQLQNSTDFQTAFSHAVQLLCDTKQRNHFIAIGKSALMAKAAVAMLVSIGIKSDFIHPVEALHGDFGLIEPGDSVFLISNSGRTTELLNLLAPLQQRQCSLIAITSQSTSPLAKAVQQTLLLPPYGENCPLNQAPITSTVSTLAMCQLMVAACLERRSYALQTYAQNHPGGDIGRKIYLKVESLMAKNDELPIAQPHASFKECISKITQFSLGGLLILNGKQLIGLITEKDLRIAIENQGPGVFNLSAADIMNPKPITIQYGTLAIDALRTMEKRPSPLNLVPVTDDFGNAVGLLRIHDLIKAGIVLEN